MKLETQMLIAKNIRTLRTSKCISQTDFAKMVGAVSYTHLDVYKRQSGAGPEAVLRRRRPATFLRRSR